MELFYQRNLQSNQQHKSQFVSSLERWSELPGLENSGAKIYLEEGGRRERVDLVHLGRPSITASLQLRVPLLWTREDWRRWRRHGDRAPNPTSAGLLSDIAFPA